MGTARFPRQTEGLPTNRWQASKSWESYDVNRDVVRQLLPEEPMNGQAEETVGHWIWKELPNSRERAGASGLWLSCEGQMFSDNS